MFYYNSFLRQIRYLAREYRLCVNEYVVSARAPRVYLWASSIRQMRWKRDIVHLHVHLYSFKFVIVVLHLDIKYTADGVETLSEIT